MTVVFRRLSILIACLFGFYVWAATERYIIYPQERYSHEARQQFTTKLNQLAGTHGNVYTSIRLRFQEIRFWCADLTETAYKELSKDPLVLGIEVVKRVINLNTENELSDKNSTYLFRPTSEMTPSNLSASEENFIYFTQKSPVATELRALSQPPRTGSIQNYPNYVYPDGGVPTYIYHVEVGINRQHLDFQGRNVEWLYTQLSIKAGADRQTEAPVGGGHSTCTASKAVGNLYGASKKATLVVVKMPDLSQPSAYEVLDTVIDDIHYQDRKATSVVSVSWTAPFASFLAQRLEQQIIELMAMGVPFVCAAGNAAQEPDVHGGTRIFTDTSPAFFPSAEPYWPFFAVGNSEIDGRRCPTSQLSLQGIRPQVYAPGVDITCASSRSIIGSRTDTGTSFSAPLVAGVIADLLSTRQFSYNLVFWWKRPDGENVVWNLVDEIHNPPVVGSGNATLVNYTSPVFAATGFSNEQSDVSTD